MSLAQPPTSQTLPDYLTLHLLSLPPLTSYHQDWHFHVTHGFQEYLKYKKLGEDERIPNAIRPCMEKEGTEYILNFDAMQYFLFRLVAAPSLERQKSANSSTTVGRPVAVNAGAYNHRDPVSIKRYAVIMKDYIQHYAQETDRISYVSEFFFTLIALFWFGSPPFDEEILRLSNTTLTIIIQQIGRDKGLERAAYKIIQRAYYDQARYIFDNNTSAAKRLLVSEGLRIWLQPQDAAFINDNITFYINIAKSYLKQFEFIEYSDYSSPNWELIGNLHAVLNLLLRETVTDAIYRYENPNPRNDGEPSRPSTPLIRSSSQNFSTTTPPSASVTPLNYDYQQFAITDKFYYSHNPAHIKAICDSIAQAVSKNWSGKNRWPKEPNEKSTDNTKRLEEIYDKIRQIWSTANIISLENRTINKDQSSIIVSHTNLSSEEKERLAAGLLLCSNLGVQSLHKDRKVHSETPEIRFLLPILDSLGWGLTFVVLLQCLLVMRLFPGAKPTVNKFLTSVGLQKKRPRKILLLRKLTNPLSLMIAIAGVLVVNLVFRLCGWKWALVLFMCAIMSQILLNSSARTATNKSNPDSAVFQGSQ